MGESGGGRTREGIVRWGSASIYYLASGTPPLQFQASQNQSHSATFNPLGPQEDQFALCREACWVSLHVGRHHIYI